MRKTHFCFRIVEFLEWSTVQQSDYGQRSKGHHWDFGSGRNGEDCKGRPLGMSFGGGSDYKERHVDHPKTSRTSPRSAPPNLLVCPFHPLCPPIHFLFCLVFSFFVFPVSFKFFGCTFVEGAGVHTCQSAQRQPHNYTTTLHDIITLPHRHTASHNTTPHHTATLQHTTTSPDTFTELRLTSRFDPAHDTTYTRTRHARATSALSITPPFPPPHPIYQASYLALPLSTTAPLHTRVLTTPARFPECWTRRLRLRTAAVCNPTSAAECTRRISLTNARSRACLFEGPRAMVSTRHFENARRLGASDPCNRDSKFQSNTRPSCRRPRVSASREKKITFLNFCHARLGT